MHLCTYLSFNGNCREAFEFYRDCLGGEITAMMTWAECPEGSEMPAEIRDTIMHGSIDIGGHTLMGTDNPPADPFQGVKGAHVMLGLDDVEKSESLFAELSKAGQVVMPLEKTFFASRFGMLVDRFGIPWMIHCE